MVLQHRSTRALAVIALSSTVALTGCSSASTSTDAVSTTSQPTATAAATPVTCPTENTKAFAKTRFVADLGLAAGTFHRYIYKPYQAGAFKQGADGRTLALAKAAATAALDAKLLANAVDNAKANPSLCRSVYTPLTKAEAAFKDLAGKITTGDVSGIAAIESLIQAAIKGSNATGNKIVETSN